MAEQIQILITEGNKDDFLKSIDEIVKENIQNYLPTPKKETKTKYLSRKDAAAFLGCSLPTIDKYRSNGTIKYTKLGSKVLIDFESLKEYLRKHHNHKIIGNEHH